MCDHVDYHPDFTAGSPIRLSVGDELGTPYGVAVVLSFNEERQEIVTTKGSWGFEEVYPKTPPEPGEDVVRWLLGPRLEVRTTYATTHRRCACNCGCQTMRMVERGTGTVTFHEHLAGFACICSRTQCACLPSD